MQIIGCIDDNMDACAAAELACQGLEITGLESPIIDDGHGPCLHTTAHSFVTYASALTLSLGYLRMGTCADLGHHSSTSLLSRLCKLLLVNLLNGRVA